MRILLTGASSFTGYWFARELVEKGTFTTLDGWAIPYAELNKLVT